MLTQYARALDSQWAQPILGDTLAAEIVAKIDYDFAGLGVPASVVCQTALRAKMLDERVRAFTAEHPDAVVVDLGAGLDSGPFRVCPPDTVDWYSVDLPGVSALRRQLMPTSPRAHVVTASMADQSWPNTIPANRPVMVIADGLFAFLSEPVLIGVFRRVTTYFTSGELAFNDYGRIGRFTRLTVKLAPQRMFSSVGAQWGYLGFDDPRVPEKWNPLLKLVEEASLAHAPEVELFPGWIRLATKVSGMFEASARKARILRYQF
ncbi:putative O-methyltransferase Omt [Mycobacterium montefiorense]|uniref:O-methyltransferase Omt n=1 Tax=Mycobacterium montefiorense TaxID=154654 RepID=A0AA37PJL5_9MYCO|nr:putative O-methyltransferase Omt [Mycobacterium montefiorense]GKU47987.1 putative O-methyltransferase Omt [Mycobacterium montefiorense]GKU68557.1 putative O-methyltransferase Omt [Mycobacterium montefiorense]GKU70776.1 putative O-methyltransferase Omt [Mycobacterium montefiorense]